MARPFAIAIVLLLAGCGGASRPAPAPAPRVAAPDAGMRAGHGAEPARVRVPAADRSAPAAVLRLGSAEAVSGGTPAAVRLSAPVLRPVAVGRDKQGMGRVRISLQARIACRDAVMPLIRYFPPPAIARVRLAPGTLAPTELTRAVRIDLAKRCAGGLERADGQLWADATSAWETEASSAPIRFSYRP